MIDTQSILLYSHPNENNEMQLQSLVKTVELSENIIITRKMDQLVKILKRQISGVVAAIIFAGSVEELHELHRLQDQLNRIPFILILPDQKKEIVTKAHSLRPRYLAYSDSNFSDVKDVFQKIMYKASGYWH